MVNVLIWKWISLCTFLTRFLYGADLAWDSRASREYKISPIFVQFPQPLLPNNFNIFESSKYLQSLPSHHAFPHRIHPCSRCRLHISLSRWSPKRQQSPRWVTSRSCFYKWNLYSLDCYFACATDTGNCSKTDASCLCHDKAFINATTTCIENTCKGANLTAALKAGEESCLAVVRLIPLR